MYLAQKKKMNSRSIGSVCTELHSKFYYTMLFLVLTTDCNNSSSSTKFVATVLYAKATIVYNVSSYSIFESTLPCVMIIYIKWCLLQKIKCQLCIFLKGESPFHSWFNIFVFIYFFLNSLYWNCWLEFILHIFTLEIFLYFKYYILLQFEVFEKINK